MIDPNEKIPEMFEDDSVPLELEIISFLVNGRPEINGISFFELQALTGADTGSLTGACKELENKGIFLWEEEKKLYRIDRERLNELYPF